VIRKQLDWVVEAAEEPETQFCENIVNEALIARVVCQPVHNVAVRMRGDRIDVWWRVHILLLSSDLDRRYRICRVSLDGVNGVRRNLLARIGLAVGRGVSGARGRSGSAALSLSTHNSPLAIRGAFG
jgi:hypothetical protein